MAKFRCNKCKSTKDVHKWSTILVDGEWRDKESLCKCGEYMDRIDIEDGMPGIIRTEETLRKK